MPVAPIQGNLLQARYCQYCGRELPRGSKFCWACGASVASHTPPLSSTQIQGIVVSPRAELSPITEPTNTRHISRTPEFVLGLIGGVFGLLLIPLMVFLGGFQEAFTGETTLYAQSLVAAIMSVLGLVGAVFVRSRPKQSGILLLVSGIIGIIVALGFYVGALLLLIAGILALVRKPKPEAPITTPIISAHPIASARKYCSNCGSEMAHESMFCTNCGKTLAIP